MTASIAIIGGGLVGSLLAVYLTKRGFAVDLFEMRPDPRTQDVVHGRSINLAMSHRGRSALEAVGLEEYVTQETIPMYGRMIHTLSGSTYPVQYGVYNFQHLLSIDRRKLNEKLLSIAEKQSKTRLFFQHKLAKALFSEEKCRLTFYKGESRSEEVTFEYQFVIGCDGAFSAVRREMQRSAKRFSCSVVFIDDGYVELTLPPLPDDTPPTHAPSPAERSANGTAPSTPGTTGTTLPKHRFKMAINNLHIWPREQYMLIALPNTDASYTMTLFMPFDMFDKIKKEEELVDFFDKNFPDVIPLMGKENLVSQYFAIEAQPLPYVKCNPMSYGSRVLLMGDAAHATVPFYGQGMNAGFEDCLILNEILNQTGNDMAKAIEKFSAVRIVDGHALVDLSLNNYLEMRSHVLHTNYLMRKKLDNWLHSWLGTAWTPLYSMVAFTGTPYSQCVRNRKRQDKILDRVFKGFVLMLMLALPIFSIFLSRYEFGGTASSQSSNSLQHNLANNPASRASEL